MQTFTMTHFLVCVILLALVMPMHAKPTTKPEDDNEDEMELVPVGVLAEKQDDGEVMDTANARYYPDYYFRPLYAYRRVQSQRRRVYTRKSNDGDRFPTVA